MALVGPALDLYRPHTTSVDTRLMATRKQPPGKPRESREGYSNRELYDLLERDYEWPDLPPIGQIKNAIARQRTSQGVSYILPVDKTKCSVENVFRTNLRVMFQDPYTADKQGQYDETQVRISAKHHFEPNTVPTAYKRNMLPDPRQYEVSAESEKVRKQYAKSAPSTGLAARRSLTNTDLKQRSNLYLPLKAKIPEEAMKLKAEADKIIKSVQEKDEEYDPTKDKIAIPKKRAEMMKLLRKNKPKNVHGIGREGARGPRLHLSSGSTSEADCSTVQKKTEYFESYESLKNTSVPRIKPMPEYVKESRFLSEDKKVNIWEWLNKDDQQNEFTYFLDVCS